MRNKNIEKDSGSKMVNKIMKEYPVPEFNSLQEEDEYWKTHSPLDEGYEGEVQEAKQKRSSFLSIRMTGEELSRLKYVADQVGMKPSAVVRQLIKETMERKGRMMSHASGTLEPVLRDRAAGARYQAADNKHENELNTIRAKAIDACSRALESGPNELHVKLDAVLEALRTILVTASGDPS